MTTEQRAELVRQYELAGHIDADRAAELTEASSQTHWHVENGIAGYGPDTGEGTPTFDSLADALDYARDELNEFADMAHQAAHALAEQGQFEDAWRESTRVEALDVLRGNLDPKRRNAPLYRDNATAYASLLESQAAEFPHDVSYNVRLYLWPCDAAECHDDNDDN
jgi:hypothetical protein